MTFMPSLLKKSVSSSFLLLFILFTNNVLANIYTWVDKNGKTHFSNAPIENATEHKLKQNTQNQISIEVIANNKVLSTKEINYQFSIISPQQEATIRNNNGAFSVQASIAPMPPKNTEFQLYIDGIAIDEPKLSPLFYLSGINRGEHKLQIKAMLANGNLLTETPITRVFLHRAIQKQKPSLRKTN